MNSNLGVEIARDTMAKFVNCPTLFLPVFASVGGGGAREVRGVGGGARKVGGGGGEGGGGEDYVFTPPTGSYHIHLFQGLFADEKKLSCSLEVKSGN